MQELDWDEELLSEEDDKNYIDPEHLEWYEANVDHIDIDCNFYDAAGHYIESPFSEEEDRRYIEREFPDMEEE